MMIKNYLFALLLLIFSYDSFAQGEANNWFFGDNASVSFNSGSPVALPGGQIQTNEGSASISDAQGNLLFYTDGISVWNKNHQAMPGANYTLNGNPSSTSSGLIVPSPGNSNLYYIFTVDEPSHSGSAASNHGLNYTVIDMSLDNGNGDVAQLNVPLVTYNTSDTEETRYKCSEKITAVKSSDCSSFWVITHFTNNFYSFEVNSTGVSNTPVVSTTPTLVPLSGYRRNAIGYIKSSPDGSKLAVAHSHIGTELGNNNSAPGGVFLYDFDTTSGVVSNEEEVYNRANGDGPYGVEFSRSGERLYTTVNDAANNSKLIQLDLTVADIPASKVIIDEFSQYAHGALQLGPDGKIYRALLNFNTGYGGFLGVINDPEVIGLGCNYDEQGVALDIQSTGVIEGTRLGLPPFIQSLFAEKVDIINNDNDPTLVTNTLELCQGDTYTLAAENIPGATYTWTLDGNPLTNSTHELIDISIEGTYLVEINPNNGDCPFFGEAIVTVQPLPIINSITPLEQCEDPTDGLSDFTLSDANTEALAGQDDAVVITSYHEDVANALAGTNPIGTVYPSAGETIYIRLYNNDTGCVNAVPVNLVVNPLPVITSPVILEQCDTDTDGSVSFNLNEANSLLSNNSANETFVYFNSLAEAQANSNPITTPTNYTSSTGNNVYAQITNSNGCINYGRINLTVGTSAIPSTLQDSYTECDDDYDGIATFDFSASHTTLATLFAGVNSTITYYENEADALAETNAIPDISNHQNTNSPNTQTIWVRVDSNDLNGCLGLGEHITLTVNPIPEDITLTTVIGCSDTATAEFDLSNVYTEAANGATDVVVTIHEDVAEAENDTNAISSPYTSNATTVYVRVENTTTNCYITIPLNLVIEPLPIANMPDPIDMCNDASSTGYVEFDLTVRHDQIIGSQTDVTLLYFTDMVDAQAGSGPSLIADPVHFMNTSTPQQTVYVHVSNNITGCTNTTSLVLNVLDAPQAFPFTNPLIICDDDNDGFGYFDLSTLESEITGNTSGVNITFHETITQAEQNLGAINTNEPYQNVDTGIPGHQTVYARLSLAGLGCNTIIAVQLEVLNSPELPSEPLVYSICDDYNVIGDGFVQFDLPSYEENYIYSTIIANAGNDPTIMDQYHATYYTALDASNNPDPTSIINNPNTFENTSAPDQVIYVSVEHIGSATVPATGCATVKEITLHVDLLPTALYTPINQCDTDGVSDDMFTFDLTNYISQITNGESDVDVQFFEVEADAEVGFGPSLITNPTAYTNTISNPQSIYASVYRPSTGCRAVALVVLHVDPLPTPMTNQDIIDTLGNFGVMEVCDGNVDGSGSLEEQVAEFDLTLWETQILTGDGPNIESGVSASYYTDYDAAEGGDPADAIATPEAYTNTSNPQTIYVRVTNDGTGVATSGTGCYVIVQFDIFVPVPEVTISGNAVLCVDENGTPLSNATLPVLTAHATPAADYNYQWTLNGVIIPAATESTYTVTQAGEYTVTVSGPTDFDCVNYASVTVIESGMPADYDATVTTTAFASNHQIQATATSSIPGITFYYTLDLNVATGEGVETNISGLFTNVTPGYHTITISDGRGCWTDTISVTIIDYPHFFTPNGDGVNDTWKIIGQEGIPISQIYIFDRYGKLMTQLDPDGRGWDGTYNGHAMPAGDYWFKIIYVEGDANPTQKEFKAHFSIKR